MTPTDFSPCPRFSYPEDFDHDKFDAWLGQSGITGSAPVEDVLVDIEVAERAGDRLLFRNAGVLFFARNVRRFFPEASITCLLGKGADQVCILDRKDFDGGIVADIEDAMEAKKTVFNFVATCNDFERSLAEFLDRAEDVLRFAARGTSEQGSSGTPFRVDYLKASGAIGFYYPDWVAVQKDPEGAEVNWIIETNDRGREGTEEKDATMREWCRRTTEATGVPWHYIRVNRTDFRSDFATLRELVFEVIGNAMFLERDRRNTTMSRKEVRQALDEGRA